MSFVQEVLYAVSNYPGGYRLIYNLLYNEKKPGDKKISEINLSNTLSRLRRRGLLENRARRWSITPEGKEFLASRNSDIRRFFPKERPLGKIQKNLIIIFDIPEKERRYRDWFRSELVGFGFEQIQKSVWFGPNLPKEFIEYLGTENLLSYIRFFRASEKDLI